MTKEISVGEKILTFTANGATPVFYKRLFHSDLISLMTEENSTQIALDKVPEMGFIMAMQASGESMLNLTEDKYIEWLTQFGPLDLVKAGKEIVSVFIGNMKTSSDAKKNPKG